MSSEPPTVYTFLLESVLQNLADGAPDEMRVEKHWTNFPFFVFLDAFNDLSNSSEREDLFDLENILIWVLHNVAVEFDQSLGAVHVVNCWRGGVILGYA